MRSTGKKGQITVVACGNASGKILPPILIFDAKKFCHAWTRGEVPRTTYGLSDKGWINIGFLKAGLVTIF